MSKSCTKLYQKSTNSSVDSATAITAVPVDSAAIDSSSSVQSTGYLLPDSLTIAYERFARNGSTVGHEARIKRSVCNLIQRSQSEGMHVKNIQSKKVQKLDVPKNLRVISKTTRKAVPPANLLRPPRGSLVCPTRDLNRELLAIRRLPRSERFSAGARFIRTLDTSCPSHNDIAQSIFLICTL